MSHVSLLRFVAKAALPLLSGGILEIGASILVSVWESWEKSTDEKRRQQELAHLLQLQEQQFRQVVRELIAELAGNHDPAAQSRLQSYLFAMRSQIRRTFRRPSDVAGLTIPKGLRLVKMTDLAAFLPERAPRFSPGDRIPGCDFELVELLGIGGFGEVWKARNAYMNDSKPVALKFCLDNSAAKSLRLEGTLLDKIQHEGQHEGIVQLKLPFLSAEPPFLVYECVEGGDLGGLIAEWTRTQGEIEPNKAGNLIRQLAEILDYAHRKKIIHRDLKPANILVTQANDKLRLKVTDFGIGSIASEVANRASASQRNTRTILAGLGAYSLLYASPEQIRGAKPDYRDDVHALGVIWWQLLCGDLTADAPRGPGWKKRLQERGMNPRWIELLEACTASDRADRPTDAGELLAELESGAPSKPQKSNKSREDDPLPPRSTSKSKSNTPSRVSAKAVSEVSKIPSKQLKEKLRNDLKDICTAQGKIGAVTSWIYWLNTGVLCVPLFILVLSIVGSTSESRTRANKRVLGDTIEREYQSKGWNVKHMGYGGFTGTKYVEAQQEFYRRAPSESADMLLAFSAAGGAVTLYCFYRRWRRGRIIASETAVISSLAYAVQQDYPVALAEIDLSSPKQVRELMKYLE